MKEYLYQSEKKLHIAFYESEIKLAKATVVLFFGGGWTEDNHLQFSDHANALTKEGYNAVLPEYSTISKFPGNKVRNSIDDAVASVDYIVAHKDELGVDPTKLVYGGGSSGGHLALCAELFGKYPAAAYTLFNPATVIPTFVDDDLEYLLSFMPHWKGNAALFDGDEVKTLSPHTLVKTKLGPQIIFHGEIDRVVPLKSMHEWKRICEDLGGSVEIVVFPGKQHGFFNLEPEKTEVIKLMIGFLNKNFK